MARKVWVPAVSGPLAPYAVKFESWQHLIDGRGALDYVRVIVHHSGDLLTGSPLPHTTADKPCSGGHLSLSPGRNNRHYAVDPGSERGGAPKYQRGAGYFVTVCCNLEGADLQDVSVRRDSLPQV